MAFTLAQRRRQASTTRVDSGSATRLPQWSNDALPSVDALRHYPALGQLPAARHLLNRQLALFEVVTRRYSAKHITFTHRRVFGRVAGQAYVVPESGGPTTQSGIGYQDAIAALYLGRMCDPRERLARERVRAVRVEAAAAVDDIEVQFGDGSTGWIQAKERVNPSQPEWKKLWRDFATLRQSETFKHSDRLILWLGEPTTKQRILREVCLRAHGASAAAEWWSALSGEQQEIAKAVLALFPSGRQELSDGFEVFAALEVSLHPYEEIRRDLAPNWLPALTSTTTSAFFQILAAKALVAARNRRRYVRTDLETELTNDGIRLSSLEPGIEEYQRALKKELGILSVPGTSLSAPIEQAYFWPRLRTIEDGLRRANVDDEFFQEEGDSVDPLLIPDGPSTKAVIVGGAGFGKSALLRAIAHRHTGGALLPAIVPLVGLVDSGAGVLEYLETKLNRTYSVNIDWGEVCASGRALVLLDGLDELSTNGRSKALSSLEAFSARFPECSWILTIRELAGTAVPLGARLFQVQPLRPQDVERFAIGWLQDERRDEIAAELSRLIGLNASLARLTRAPLLLALLVHRARSDGSPLPERRIEVFEEYVSSFLRPGAHKPSAIELDEFSLLRCAQRLAFEVLGRDTLTLSGSEIVALDECRTNGCVDGLVSCGLIRRDGSRIGFVLPLVQEYLAGSYLARRSTQELTDIARSQLSRPWTQALLFAMEQLKDAGPLASAICQFPDDAFSTNLKFLGRAIANGATIPDRIKDDVAESLAKTWKNEGRSGRDAGLIIADAFAKRLPPTARGVLESGEGLEQGGSAILVAAQDDELTLNVLDACLKVPIPGHFQGWQPALDRVRELASAKLIARARRQMGVAPVRVSFWIAYLLGELAPVRSPEDPRTAAAADPSLDLLSRISCHLGIGDPIVSDNLLVEGWKHYVAHEGPTPTPWFHMLIKALLSHPDPVRVWHRCLKAIDHTPLHAKPRAWWLFGLFPADAYWRTMLFGLAERCPSDLALDALGSVDDSKLNASRQTYLHLCRAFLGDETSYRILADSLETQRKSDISGWLMLMDRFPVAIVAGGISRLRDLPSEDRRELAVSLIFTLRHEVEIRGLSGSASGSARRLHECAGLGADILLEWATSCQVGDKDWFRFMAGAVNLGRQRVAKPLLLALRGRLLEAGPWDSALDDSMAEALAALIEIGATIPTSLLGEALRKSDRNVAHRARDRLARTRTNQALKMLLDDYNSANTINRQLLMKHLESLARSLGRRIVKTPNSALAIE